MGKIMKNGVVYSGNNTVEVTQQEYDTLTQAQKENGTIYFVTDGVPKSTATSYVIEQGTSDMWTYRKWSDGTAECWGYTSKTLNISANNVASFGTLNFPTSLFISAPVLNVSGGADSQPSIAPFYSQSSVAGADIWFFNRTSTSYTGKNLFVHCHAIGRWK